jgi:SAM-dependent methyltransferase
VARAVAAENGIEVYARSEDLPSGCMVDLIVSDNALEHTTAPLQELQSLYKRLRPGGKIVVVVPCEGISMPYNPRDMHHHLFSWSPSSLGNLMAEAGFQVLECKPYIHKWPPMARFFARFGRPTFDLISGLYGRVARSWFQVRAVAVKTAS